MNDREKIIQNYIDGYNQFDTDKMVADFDDDVIFENIQNGNVNMSLAGLQAFREQAEQAKAYFTKRKQTILSTRHSGDTSEIEINYYAVLGMDFPNGLKKGQELTMQGRSVFEFRGNRIIKLTDLS
ncbi:nuclear transport factor 2 family protein [Flavihumibacter sp.]|uniref:nuclear transport factor 2 family protein n=1 Tax=Flavihumibacter sp. TaxID=1913981 RepID=UPI002FC67805